MSCRDAVFARNGTINCIIFEENTRQPYNENLCRSRALALLLHGNLNWKKKRRNFLSYP